MDGELEIYEWSSRYGLGQVWWIRMCGVGWDRAYLWKWGVVTNGVGVAL